MPFESQFVPEYIPNLAAGGCQRITIPAAAATLKSLMTGAAFHADTKIVQVCVETAGLRIDPTGGVPSATVGRQFAADTAFELSRQEADVAQVIRLAAGSVAQVFQYK